MSGASILVHALVKHLNFEMRWAQLRHLRCTGCRATYWALVGERVKVQTSGFRFTTSDFDLRRQADDQMRSRSAPLGRDPGFGFAPCPHCKCLPAANARWAWGRAILAGLGIGAVPAAVGAIYVGVVRLHDRSDQIRWTAAICTVLAVVAVVIWLVHALLPSLPRWISPGRFPTADEASFHRLLARCGPDDAPERVWFASIPGESEPADGWTLLPPEDWTSDGRIHAQSLETPPPFIP
ncbi:MAG: hypothetical protein K8T90_02190 [Planctomycetes bacterium]|nr:hypothetical protein [Planctomycetota bacterium]